MGEAISALPASIRSGRVEHAYYLKFQNRRPTTSKEFWNVVNWDGTAARFAAKNNLYCIVCRSASLMTRFLYPRKEQQMHYPVDAFIGKIRD